MCPMKQSASAVHKSQRDDGKNPRVLNLLQANWLLPNEIKTCITQANTQLLDMPQSDSSRNFNIQNYGFNLATHVGDDLSMVLMRRKYLREILALLNEPAWVSQVSQSRVICLEDDYTGVSQEADASFTFEKNRICVVNTADCLPILVSDTQGNFVAAIHAGWQGLQLDIISKALVAIQQKAKTLQCKLGQTHAYIAPSISQANYQVGQDFQSRFVRMSALYAEDFLAEECASGSQSCTYLANLNAIAKKQLLHSGVSHIHESQICTYQNNSFYSHRRACHLGNKNEGRFASMIWRT